MATSSEYLPELPEDLAEGDVKSIYGEIRRLSAVPMVALVYRHLATLDGVLPAAWNMLAPLFVSGRLQDAAWRVSATVNPDPLTPLRPAALAVLGIESHALGVIRTVLDAYNRANPVNLLAVTCLALRMSQRRSQTLVPRSRAWSPPKAIPALPPMVAPADMDPALRALLDEMVVGAESGRQVMPSLYRHLTGWPGYIGLANLLVMPRIEDRSIEREIRRVRSAMQRQAVEFAPFIALDPLLASAPGVADALVKFSDVIPEMIVVGALLASAMPGTTPRRPVLPSPNIP